MGNVNDERASNVDANYRRLSDAACKQLLGDKLILACILKGCVPEFMDCEVSDIETKYIEGEPEIGSVGVHAETTNPPKPQKGSKIHGISNESATDTEGKVTFDIRFYALTPADERVKLIINVEAQNDFYPGYPLIKRAIYFSGSPWRIFRSCLRALRLAPLSGLAWGQLRILSASYCQRKAWRFLRL